MAAACRTAEYTSLAGVKATGFQKWIDDAHDQGYQPNYVNGYDVGDHAEFAGVAVKDPTVEEFDYRLNITADEFDQFQDEMTKKGFRSGFISGYMAGKGRALQQFGKDKNKHPVVPAEINLTRKQFEESVAEMRKKGMDPHGTSAYQGADGAVRYLVGFTQRGKGQHWEERHDLSEGDFEAQVKRWSANDFVVSSLHAYNTPDGLRWMATAVKEDNPVVVGKERHGMTGDEYQKAFDKLGEEGYRPRTICEYLDDGQPRFAVIWFKWLK